MAESDPNLGAWALGAVGTALSGAFTWVWNRLVGLETRLDARMNKIEEKAGTAASNADLKELWQAHTAERASAQQYRENMLIRIGETPTKADLEHVERRLLDAIRARQQAGAD